MPIFALFNLDDTGNLALDSAPANGDQLGTYINGATAEGGQAVLDGDNDLVKIFPDPSFQMDSGTVNIQFTTADAEISTTQTVLSRDSVGQTDGGYHVDILADGSIQIVHESATGSESFGTEPGFVSSGETVNLTYSWDEATGGQLTIENLTSAEVFNAPVPAGLTMDMGGADQNQPWIIGAGQATSDPAILNNIDQHFAGTVEVFSLSDSVDNLAVDDSDDDDDDDHDDDDHDDEDHDGDDHDHDDDDHDDNDDHSDDDDDKMRDGIVSGTAGDDLINFAYTGDPDGDMIDHSDALLPGAAPQDDYVRAGGGNDTVLAGAGNDIVFGSDGNDLLDGGIGNDTLYGENGNDTLIGGAGNNTLSGGSGDDVFSGGVGADVFNGGAGQDNLDYFSSAGPVNVNLTTGVLSGGDADNDSIQGGIDGVIGSEFGDHLVGFNQQGTGPSDTYTNQFFGNGGNDTIEGKGGNDLIDGGADQDLLSGGDGDDTIYGGTGNDSIIGGRGADSLSGGDDRDIFLGANAGDVVDGGEGGDDHDTLDLRGSGPLRVNYASDNPENGTVDFLDGDGNITGSMSFENIENVMPCFTPGTMIATPKGEVLVETLRAGDKVITRDNGIQEIRWTGAKPVSWRDLTARPHLKPILVRQGSLGNGLPERDMMVSPNHRLLVANDRTALYFDEHEVLVAAKHLVGGKGVQQVDSIGTCYIHFMFDQHEVVLSNGAWTESFQPGDYTLKGMGNAQRNEIFELFPELKTDVGVEGYTAARRTLKRHEALLLAR